MKVVLLILAFFAALTFATEVRVFEVNFPLDYSEPLLGEGSHHIPKFFSRTLSRQRLAF
jgi:hypothetical protein